MHMGRHHAHRPRLGCSSGADGHQEAQCALRVCGKSCAYNHKSIRTVSDPRARPAARPRQRRRCRRRLRSAAPPPRGGRRRPARRGPAGSSAASAPRMPARGRARSRPLRGAEPPPSLPPPLKQRSTPARAATAVTTSRPAPSPRPAPLAQVKHAQQTWHDKLTQILDDFPKVEDIHPFYGDLLNVLYDRDHYKLALGQLNTARNLIDKLTQGVCVCSVIGAGSGLGLRWRGLNLAGLAAGRPARGAAQRGRLATLGPGSAIPIRAARMHATHTTEIPLSPPPPQTMCACSSMATRCTAARSSRGPRW